MLKWDSLSGISQGAGIHDMVKTGKSMMNKEQIAALSLKWSIFRITNLPITPPIAPAEWVYRSDGVILVE